MVTHNLDRLAAREREILHAVFALGNRASAEDIRAQLTSPPSYSTVRVMLSRLEKKGYLRHTVEGPRYVYSAKTTLAAAARRAVQRHVQTFFGGSLAQMVTSLVREGTWTKEELTALKAEIERVAKEKP